MSASSLNAITHGMSGTPTYLSWLSMKARCQDKLNEDYGGRGISVCKRWDEFENFLSDIGERPELKSIERKNNDGNYEPSNCFWASRVEQNQNRRNALWFDAFGERLNLAEWSRKTGIKYATLYKRIVIKGQTPEIALIA